LNDFRGDTSFISSFRLYPERTYYDSGDDQEVGRFGENYENVIHYWQMKKDDRIKDLNKILKQIGLIKSIRAKKMPAGRFEIRTRRPQSTVEVALNDIGFGVNQFVPIVVNDLLLRENGNLIVAQPEIHLHPSAQANMADYIIKRNKESGISYCFETHSEFLINRLRLRVIEGEIQSEEIKLYYLEHKGGKCTGHRITMAEDGGLVGAPRNFFDTYMMDIADIALSI
jgi:predicted ATPase